MTIWAKDNGVWKEVLPAVNVGGDWGKLSSVHVKDGGAWKEVWPQQVNIGPFSVTAVGTGGGAANSWSTNSNGFSRLYTGKATGANSYTSAFFARDDGGDQPNIITHRGFQGTSVANLKNNMYYDQDWPSGSKFIVGFSSRVSTNGDTSKQITSMVDVKGNAYSKVARSSQANGFGTIELWAAEISTEVASGDKIDFSLTSGSITNNGAQGIVIVVNKNAVNQVMGATGTYTITMNQSFGGTSYNFTTANEATGGQSGGVHAVFGQ